MEGELAAAVAAATRLDPQDTVTFARSQTGWRVWPGGMPVGHLRPVFRVGRRAGWTAHLPLGICVDGGRVHPCRQKAALALLGALRRAGGVR